MPVFGDYYAHDPSRLIKQGNTYYLYRTSQGIMAKYSTDLRNWTYAGQVFPGTPPAWTTNAVPGFTGFFWAPDLVFLNGIYYLYYAVSSFGSQVSAIGLVTTTNLATGPWTDQGAVIQSSIGDPYNCIDPCPLLDTNGTMWLTFGSYWNGIYVFQLDPATGKRIAPNSTLTRLAYNSSIEASFIWQHGGYYYLFVNFGSCCSGINSTYNIRVGRSTAITGPYLDRRGVSLVNGGGSMFLESTARFVGPGHAGIIEENGTNWFTYHYYDGNNGGTATLGLAPLTWSADGWPQVTNDWSAFYPLQVDAREHLGLYNGALKNSATTVPEPGRGNVLNLDGVSQFASLPGSIANASSFAAWVKWNGGGDWQRIFDFGSNSTRYFFLSPRVANGKMRFAITTAGNGSEQAIDAPSALATGAWQHVAITLDGTRGVMYLNGAPIATNSSLSIRPWQTLARSNYLGKSQFASDPYFNGRIDSFRIFGRALSPAEIRDIAWAHPALAHRYSFSSKAWDSIGMAHGFLMGDATVTNNALRLSGTPGGYLNLPGGLLSGSSAVTLELWANFGANSNSARAFDFGNVSGSVGQNYLFFSPHTGLGTQRAEISAGTTTSLDVSGTLDNRTVHLACVVDPATGYEIYTNGVLERSLTNTLPTLTAISRAWSFVGRSLFAADSWLNATIDEFRIYDGHLGAQEIAADVAGGPDGFEIPVTLMVSNSPGSVTLSWPAYAAGFSLEANSTLTPAGWTPVAAKPALSGDAYLLTLPADGGPGYFRLRR